MPLADLNSKPSSRTERDNSIPRTKQALKDNYGADVTALDDEQDAQVAEYEQDDDKIKDAEDARDDDDSTYQDSQESQSSLSSDTSYPPFVPKTRVAMDPNDEDEDEADVEPLDKSESTPGKKMNQDKAIAPAAAAASASSRATPTASTAAKELLPLFLPSSSPSPEPSSPTRPKEEPEEPLFLPASQETSAGDSEEPEKSQTYRSLFGSSSQASSTGYDEQEKSKEEKEHTKEDTGEATPPERLPPLAQRSQTTVLQTLDANCSIDNSAQDNPTAKGTDALSDANDGCVTPLARTPTQSTFDAAHWQGHGRDGGGDRTPTARSPKSQGQANGKGNNSESKAQTTSPGAKPRGNKRPAEDPISPRRSLVKASKAENEAPIADERKHKMMRKA